MAKKGKEVAPNINSVPNKDIIHRLNFLYQASAYLNGLEGSIVTGDLTPIPSIQPNESTKAGIVQSSDDVKPCAGINEQSKRKRSTRDLSRNYVKSMKIIGLKTNTRIDPSVKRAICKACNAVLTPGVTAKIRTKRNACKNQVKVLTCANCSFSRTFPTLSNADENLEVANEETSSTSVTRNG